MPRLAKMFGNDLIIAENFVHAPGYSLKVSDAPGPQDGWQYYVDNVVHEDFALPWVQPTDATNAYALGAVVSHSNSIWRSTILGNVWAPGVSGWIPVTTGVPAWIQPSGATDAYQNEAVVAHNGKMWRSLLAANVWEPGVANWRESLLTPPGAVIVLPDWVQPTGAPDAYQIDAQVKHNGFNWKSTAANNVWEPGVYGWVKI